MQFDAATGPHRVLDDVSFDAATAFGILTIVGDALAIAISVVLTAAEGWFPRYRPYG